MAYTTKTVPVQHIFLDNENPRHDPIDNEPDIIRQLLAKEGVRPLAEDIAEWRGLNPLERMGVVPHLSVKDRYVTAEGNRRLCAVKLLIDPEKAPDEASRKVFRALKEEHPFKEKMLEVVVFDSEEDARHWVELRHRGPQKGKGTVPWDPTQAARFDAKRQRDNPNVLALRLLDYSVEHDLIDEDDRNRIPITTLTRYLSNRVVRDALGLASNRDLARSATDKGQFDRGIKRFLHDSFDEGPDGLSSRTNSRQREAYANRFRKRGFSPRKRSAEPINVAEPPPASSSPAGTKKQRQARDLRDPSKRRNVIPTTFRVHIEDRILRRIYIELKNIDAGEYGFAATYLLRAFIELVVKRYCKKHGIGYKAHALEAALQRATEKLEAQGVDERVLKPLRVMASDEDAFYSPDSIGNIIHGGAVAQRRALNDMWDTVEPGLVELLKRI